MTVDELAAIVAENMAFAMHRKDEMSQSELGRRSGVAQTVISLYLNPTRRKGGSGAPNLRNLAALADALEIEVWELLCPMSPEERQLMRSMEEWMKAKRSE